MDLILDVYEHEEFQKMFDQKRKPREVPLYFIATDDEVAGLSKQAQAYLKHYYLKAGEENNYLASFVVMENDRDLKVWDNVIFIEGDKRIKKKLISFSVVPAPADEGGHQLSYKLSDGKNYNLHDIIKNMMAVKFTETERRVNARDRKMQNR